VPEMHTNEERRIYHYRELKSTHLGVLDCG